MRFHVPTWQYGSYRRGLMDPTDMSLQNQQMWLCRSDRHGFTDPVDVAQRIRQMLTDVADHSLHFTFHVEKWLTLLEQGECCSSYFQGERCSSYFLQFLLQGERCSPYFLFLLQGERCSSYFLFLLSSCSQFLLVLSSSCSQFLLPAYIQGGVDSRLNVQAAKSVPKGIPLT